MVAVATDSEARKRILDAAYDLFYRQGYKSTGINQVIEVSGVAKATFYAHFPSKEDLGVAYAHERSRRELAEMLELLEPYQEPRERFLAPMALLTKWIQDVNYRGCPFQNIVIEFDDPKHPVHQAVSKSREDYQALFRELADHLIKSDPKYRDLDADRLASTYMILVEGSVMLAVIHHDPWPIRDALQTLIRLIDQR